MRSFPVPLRVLAAGDLVRSEDLIRRGLLSRETPIEPIRRESSRIVHALSSIYLLADNSKCTLTEARAGIRPGKSPYRHVAIAEFPVTENPVSQYLAGRASDAGHFSEFVLRFGHRIIK
jgi:hypothetical protein